jgi:hypothetical protein
VRTSVATARRHLEATTLPAEYSPRPRQQLVERITPDPESLRQVLLDRRQPSATTLEDDLQQQLLSPR